MRVLILLTLLLLGGCKVTEKKAKDWAYSNKDKLAEWCIDCFKPLPQEVIKGDTVFRTDTLVKTDTTEVIVKADCPDGTVVYTKCPPNKTVYVNTYTHTSDTVKVRYMDYEKAIQTKEIKIEQLQDKLVEWRKWTFILGGILVLLFAVKLVKIFV